MVSRSILTGLIAAGLLASAATADVSGFLGNWANSESEKGGFLGTFIGSDSDKSDIARIVLTPAGVNHVRIHLYGRCNPECDWGSQLGHNFSDSPDSDEVRSIAADFNAGYGTKHLTLHKGPGNTLRFDVVTEFTGHPDRHDFATSGSLRFVQAPAMAAATPAAPAAPASAPAATPLVAAAGTPAVAPAVAPAASAPASAPVVAAAPSVPPAPVVAAASEAEDCVAINPEDVYVAPSERGWKVNDFEHTILNFGTNKVAAVKASHVMEFYRFDEQCYVVRPHPKMIYWRVAGQVPRDAMPKQDCDAVNPAKVTVNGAKVVDGDRVLIDFEDDTAAAAQAASVIRTYRLSQQCFINKPDTTMVYWLAR
jgi:hypothetical protein